jgi:hypothetical protein
MGKSDALQSHNACLLTLGLVGHKVVDLGGGSVVSTDLETLVGHVKDH